jgi:cobalt-zinc-cadmium efflux system protein
MSIRKSIWQKFKTSIGLSSPLDDRFFEVIPTDLDGSSSTSILTSAHSPVQYVQCVSTSGLHKMAYTTWGDPTNPKVLLCVHGLTRRGSDFFALAKAMSGHYFVVCPDIVGRGHSDFLKNPMLYGVPQYVSDIVTLIARLNPKQLDFFGTSMGGLIGMVLAGMEQQPIRRLLLNDVGPRIEFTFISRLMSYLSKPVSFSSQEQALDYVNSLTQTFGRHSTEQLRQLNLPQLIQKNNEWILHYDPKISMPFMSQNPMTAAAGELALWQSFDKITCKTLITRGAESDLLSLATVEEMCRRNPHVGVVEIKDAGHAPAFILPEQIQVAKNFFLN